MKDRSYSALYLLTLVSMVALSIGGIVAYSTFVPNHDSGPLFSLLSLLVPPVVLALVALLRGEQTARATARIEALQEVGRTEVQEVRGELKTTHDLVNSRLDEFKRALEELSLTQIAKQRAEGLEEGLERGRAEADARTDALRAEQVADPQRHEVTLHSPPLEALLGIPQVPEDKSS